MGIAIANADAASTVVGSSHFKWPPLVPVGPERTAAGVAAVRIQLTGPVVRQCNKKHRGMGLLKAPEGPGGLRIRPSSGARDYEPLFKKIASQAVCILCINPCWHEFQAINWLTVLALPCTCAVLECRSRLYGIGVRGCTSMRPVVHANPNP